MQQITDKQLHEMAKKRVEFKVHLTVYVVVNAGLWVLWYITGSGYPWPLWPMFGWGIGLLFHYLFEYRRTELFSEDDEYNRLKKQMQNDG